MKKEYAVPEMQVLIMTECVIRTSTTELPVNPIGEDWVNPAS